MDEDTDMKSSKNLLFIGVISLCFISCGRMALAPVSDGYEPGGGKTFLKAVRQNASEAPNVSEQLALSDVRFTRDYFEGKKVVSYGDSISARAYLEDGQNDYMENLADALGFTFTRLGVRGSCLTSVLDVPKNIRSGLDLIASNRAVNEAADVAFIAYGTNDYAASVSLGKKTNDFERRKDVFTFQGAINSAIKILREHNPDIRIVFFTPIYRSDKSDRPQNGKNALLPDYCDAIKKLAEHNECRVIDMYEGVAFNADNFGAKGDLTSDGLHPNDKGHKMMSDYILSLDEEVAL